eukprot:4718161-Lingulodinium_polyedra.AAC.1
METTRQLGVAGLRPEMAALAGLFPGLPPTAWLGAVKRKETAFTMARAPALRRPENLANARQHLPHRH